MLIEKISKNTNIYQINFEEFIHNQESIQRKYKDKLESTNNIYEVIDKYILQVLEEIWEAQTAKTDEDRIYEIIDAMMYVGSLYSYMNDALDPNNSITQKIIFVSNGKSYNDLEKVKNDIISIRRLFPERKWHKNEKSALSNKSRFKISSDILMDLIKNLILMIIDPESLKILDECGINKYYEYKISNYTVIH